MVKKKLVILVMCSSNPHYKGLEFAIKETWFNLKNDDIEIIFYSDNQNENEKLPYPILRGNDLILPCKDGYNYCGVKTILALDWVSRNYDFEYIYRSNLGAFVFPERLLDFLSDKPKNKFYCGIVGEDTFHLGRLVRFASGSGYFLSKDLVDIINTKRNDFVFNSVDDVAIGALLENNGIDVNKSAKRYNICDSEINYQIGEQTVDYIPENEIYHIRLRSEDRNKDIVNMKNLYNKHLNSLK